MKASFARPGAIKAAVIGGGIIGLSIAWRLAQRNIDVTVFEAAEPGWGASRAAAGMLSVVAETGPDDRHFFDLCRASRKLWPGFARELAEAADIDLDLREQGTLLVAMSAEEEAAFAALAEAHAADRTMRALTPREWRALEPKLAGDTYAAYFAAEDAQVDNRASIAALVRALAALNVTIRTREPVSRLVTQKGRVAGIETAAGGYVFDLVILATGVETGVLARSSGLEAQVPAIAPMKGQTIALQMDRREPLLRHVVRGETYYLVPRSSGVLIVGATSEPGNFDLRIDPKATELLIAGARQLVPAVAGLPFVEAWTGLRPVTATGFPVIGETVPGLILALGHYRNGVLLAPVTAEIVAGLATDSLGPDLSALAAPHAPGV